MALGSEGTGPQAVPPLLSVVVVNLNSGEKLATTIRSFASEQTRLEVLVKDGRSRDGSWELAQRLRDEVSFPVRLHQCADRSVYEAMNQAIPLCRGRYILFMGAGDTLLSGALDAVAPQLPAHTYGLVYGDALVQGVRYDGPFTASKLADKNMCHQAVLYGRDVFRVVGPFNTRYRAFADWDLNLRAFGHPAVEARYVDVVLSRYEGGGLSDRGDPVFSRERHVAVWRGLGAVEGARAFQRSAVRWMARRMGGPRV